jgi:hypothetical protein
LAAASYGGDRAIFGFGTNNGTSGLTTVNLVSNTGVVANDFSYPNIPRYGLAAAGYGGDKAIFGYGQDLNNISITSLVSNTGVLGSDITGIGTARSYLAAASYSS